MSMGMQAIHLTVGPVSVPKNIRIIVRELVMIRSLSARLAPAPRVLTTTIIENQIDIVVIIMNQPDPFLLIPC